MVLPAAIQESVCFSAECRRGRLGRAATGVFCPFQDVHVVNAVIMERVRVVLMAGSIISIHRAAATRRQAAPATLHVLWFLAILQKTNINLCLRP